MICAMSLPADDLSLTLPRNAGWYAHPEHATVQRYWDGTAWTGEHRFALAESGSGDKPGAETRGAAREDSLTVAAAVAATRILERIAPRELRWALGVLLVVLLSGSGYAAYRALTIPPYASGRVSASCEIDGWRMRAHVYYESDGRRWKIYNVQYRLEGAQEGTTRRGVYNNFNHQVISDGDTVRSRRSPDSRLDGELYRDRTVTYVDRSATTHVELQAVFDEAAISFFLFFSEGGVDESCSARTPSLPVDG